MKKYIVILLALITIPTFAQLNKNYELNFDMFAPMCSNKAGGMFAVESGVSIQTPVTKWLNNGIGASYIVFVEPNLNSEIEDEMPWRYISSLYIPVNFNTTPFKNFSVMVTGGPIISNEINLMFKFGFKYIVDKGELKPGFNYKIYLYFNDVITNYSNEPYFNDNLLQIGIGLTI